MIGRRWVTGGLLTLLCALAPVTTANAQAAQTRYSLVHGCYTLTGPNGAAVPNASRVRMQATALGRYLLYRPDRTYLAAQPGATSAPASQPSPAADWTVEPAGGRTFTLAPQSAPRQTLRADGSVRDGKDGASRLTFTPATGCAVFPEAELNATGTPSRGSTAYGKVVGWRADASQWCSGRLPYASLDRWG